MLASSLASLASGSEFGEVCPKDGYPFYRIWNGSKGCLIFVVTNANGNLVRMYARTNLGLDGFKPASTTPGYSQRVVPGLSDQETVDLVAAFLVSL